MTKDYTETTAAEDTFYESRREFDQIVTWLASEQAGNLDHAEAEEALESRGRKLMCHLYQDHLDLRSSREEKLDSVAGADGPARTYGRSGETRGLRSIFGDVTVSRISYEARGAGSLKPLDAALNLPTGLYSHSVSRRIVEDAIKMSFEGAVADLEKTAGVHVPKRQAEKLVLDASADFEAFYREREVTAPQDTDDLMVLSADGKGVVVRKIDLREETRKRADREIKTKRKKRLSPGQKRNRKRMGTVAAVYSVPRHVRTPDEVMGVSELPDGVTPIVSKRPKPRDKRVWASIERSADAVMDDLFREALKRDPLKRRTWVFLVDGDLSQLARIRDFAALHEVPITVVCDFVHVLEYLWTAAHCFHPVGSSDAEQWVTERALDILRGKSSDVAAGMTRSATLRKLEGTNRKGVDDCARYLVNHRRFLRYDAYIAAGFPIASGVIEGACKHLVNDRLDITGARWSLPGAESVLKMRSLWASGDIDGYWAFHRKRELERNHLSRYAECPLRRAS